MSELKLLTTKEVLEILRISRKSLYNYVRKGYLTPIKFSPVKQVFDYGEITKLIERLKQRKRHGSPD